MTLPLRHCQAIGCMELVDSDKFFCEEHASIVGQDHIQQIEKCRPEGDKQKTLVAMGVSIIGFREGRL